MCKFENNERNSQLKMARALNARECANGASGKRDFEGKEHKVQTDKQRDGEHTCIRVKYVTTFIVAAPVINWL